MYEETLNQSTNEGLSFVDLLKSKGIIPGIKVSMSAFLLEEEYSHDYLIT